VDAVLTISYLKAYFNSSDPARQRDWKARCQDIAAVNATCPIPEVMEAPDGNSSAKTFFFSKQGNETVNQTVFDAAKKSEGWELMGPSVLWERVVTTVLVLVLYAVWTCLWGP